MSPIHSIETPETHVLLYPSRDGTTTLMNIQSRLSGALLVRVEPQASASGSVQSLVDHLLSDATGSAKDDALWTHFSSPKTAFREPGLIAKLHALKPTSEDERRVLRDRLLPLVMEGTYAHHLLNKYTTPNAKKIAEAVKGIHKETWETFSKKQQNVLKRAVDRLESENQLGQGLTGTLNFTQYLSRRSAPTPDEMPEIYEWLHEKLFENGRVLTLSDMIRSPSFVDRFSLAEENVVFDYMLPYSLLKISQLPKAEQRRNIFQSMEAFGWNGSFSSFFEHGLTFRNLAEGGSIIQEFNYEYLVKNKPIRGNINWNQVTGEDLDNHRSELSQAPALSKKRFHLLLNNQAALSRHQYDLYPVTYITQYGEKLEINTPNHATYHPLSAPAFAAPASAVVPLKVMLQDRDALLALSNFPAGKITQPEHVRGLRMLQDPAISQSIADAFNDKEKQKNLPTAWWDTYLDMKARNDECLPLYEDDLHMAQAECDLTYLINLHVLAAQHQRAPLRPGLETTMQRLSQEVLPLRMYRHHVDDDIQDETVDDYLYLLQQEKYLFMSRFQGNVGKAVNSMGRTQAAINRLLKTHPPRFDGFEAITSWSPEISFPHGGFDLGEGLRARPLCSWQEVIQHGGEMRHCGASYADKCLKGSYQMLEITQAGRIIATLGLRNEGRGNEPDWRINQHFGPGNALVNDAIDQTVRAFAESYCDQLNALPRPTREAQRASLPFIQVLSARMGVDLQDPAIINATRKILQDSGVAHDMQQTAIQAYKDIASSVILTDHLSALERFQFLCDCVNTMEESLGINTDELKRILEDQRKWDPQLNERHPLPDGEADIDIPF